MRTLVLKTSIKAGRCVCPGGGAGPSAGTGAWAGVPEPTNANFVSEAPIHEGGAHAHFTSSERPGNIVNSYSNAVKQAGWNVVEQGGDPFGMFGGGLTARDGSRYLKLSTSNGHINVCSWPNQPSNNNCGRNQND